MHDRKKNSRKLRETGEFWAFILPVFFFLILIELVPFIKGIMYSFTDWNGISSQWNFVGLSNYKKLLQPDSEFWKYLGLTLKYVLIIVPVGNMISLLLANLLCSNKLKTTSFSRVALFTPNVLSATVIAFLWQYLFTAVLTALGDKYGISWLSSGWLSHPKTAVLAVIIVSIWSTVGFNMIIYIAGLQSIDDGILEAALVDGASPIQQFFHVKLPMLMNSITICIFLSISSTFKLFDMPFFLTGGGPGDATTTIPIYIYNKGVASRRFGEGTAISVLLFLIILVITMIQTSITRSKEVEL